MHKTALQNQNTHRHDLQINELLELASIGLSKMFNPETQLFCFRVNRTHGSLVPEGSSIRYTIMTLLGLHRLEAAGIRSSLHVKPAFESLLKTADQITDLGDLGLLLWLSAMASPEDLGRVYSRIDIATALDRYTAGKEGRTMELSWFLSGLAHAALAPVKTTPDAATIAIKTYRLIKENQAEHGFFGHLAKGRSLAGRFRGRIGSFADQVYPIYAFSKFAHAFNVFEALDSAISCAAAICRAQGPLGQWWWHYDSLTGNTIQHYPVYAVHQHGMAPMALYALAEASQKDFSREIDRGLEWISGSNELGVDFRDRSASVIWRSAYSRAYSRHFRVAMNLLGQAEGLPSQTRMAIKLECRPYELGWLLYALSGREPTIARAPA